MVIKQPECKQTVVPQPTWTTIIQRMELQKGVFGLLLWPDPIPPGVGGRSREASIPGGGDLQRVGGSGGCGAAIPRSGLGFPSGAAWREGSGAPRRRSARPSSATFPVRHTPPGGSQRGRGPGGRR